MDDVWKAAEHAVITGDIDTLERLLREHPQLLRGPEWLESEKVRADPRMRAALVV